MTFRLEIIQIVNSLPLGVWYPRVALDVWIDFSSRTIKLFTVKIPGKSPFLFLSLSLFIQFFFFPHPVCFPSFFLLFFFSSLIHRTSPFLFAHALFPFPFLFLFLSHFLIYFFFFPFSFLFLIWISSTKWSKSGGNFPPLASIATCHHHKFSLNFLIFLFPLYPSFDTWLNVSHSHKCTRWLIPCVTPLGCHVPST